MRDGVSEAFGRPDDLIRRQHQHDGARIVRVDSGGRGRDRGGGVSRGRFEHDVGAALTCLT